MTKNDDSLANYQSKYCYLDSEVLLNNYNVTGGSNLTLFEVEEAAEVIRQSANTDINTIFGAVINENLNDELIVTVIATGFEDERQPLHTYPNTNSSSSGEDDQDDTEVPSFLRNRGF